MNKFSINNDISKALSDNKPVNDKKLKQNIKKAKKELKTLKKRTGVKNQKEIAKTKRKIVTATHALANRIPVKIGRKIYSIKESYLKKLKDPEKYIDNLYRRSIEADLKNASGDSPQLKSLIALYRKSYLGTEKYNGGLIENKTEELYRSSQRINSLSTPYEDEFSDLSWMDISSDELEQIEDERYPKILKSVVGDNGLSLEIILIS